VLTFPATSFGDAQISVEALEASTADGGVAVLGDRGSTAGVGFSIEGGYLLTSKDSGVSWTHHVPEAFDGTAVGDLGVNSDGTEWAVVLSDFIDSRDEYLLSKASDPAGPWTAPERFSDLAPRIFVGAETVISNPARGDRWGMFVWGFAEPGNIDSDQTWFDAEWFADPGYPNLDPGFPVALDAAPATPPAVVQLDDDPQLEIVFSDNANRVQVYEHDGTRRAGWPVQVAAITGAHQQVAVGDLTGDGRAAIVVGDSESDVYAFDASGEVIEGFPVNLGFFDDTYVAVGPVAAPYRRSIVAAGEAAVFVINWRGAVQTSWIGKVASDIGLPPSIGDVDADGVSDILVPNGTFLTRFGAEDADPLWTVDFAPARPSAPVTLVDLDQNGELQIVVPLDDGRLVRLDPDANEIWSYSTSGGWPIGRVAAAQFIGTTAPDLTFTWIDEVHLVYADGTSQSNYPQSSGQGAGGFLTAPVLDTAHWSSSDILAASSASEGWAFVNIGGVAEGWPKAMPGPSTLAPATGDVDRDFDNEIVVLTDSQLLVYDVNFPASSDPSRKWPMAGYDPGRTNCANCAGEVVTSVDGQPAVTTLAFPAPAPNPTRGASTFTFALPRRAGVQLDVFDLRGRRVRRLVREDFAAGRHEVHFDAKDDRGRALANGTYVALLRVRGEGLDHEASRKLVVSR
jgi:hypothetical protein